MANENRIEFYKDLPMDEDHLKLTTIIRHESGTIAMDFRSHGSPYMSFCCHLTHEQAQAIYNELALALAGETNCPEEPKATSDAAVP